MYGKFPKTKSKKRIQPQVKIFFDRYRPVFFIFFEKILGSGEVMDPRYFSIKFFFTVIDQCF